jgi:surface polysaccharide O-acyltransferase-like enzyme
VQQSAHLDRSPRPAVLAAVEAQSRINWLDGLRVLACFLVIVSHSTDLYVETASGAYFVTVVRACVPLFVMISGALLLPMRGTTEEFLRRRFSRLVAPFLIWGVILALLPIPGAEPDWAPTGNILHGLVEKGSLSLMAYNILMLPCNFTGSNVHFWFLYVIMGLYLFIPIISPWIRQTTTGRLLVFLSLWGFTLCLPYFQHLPGHGFFPALHGECDWNARGMTYYFGGYLGYLVLGHLLTRLPKLTAGRGLALAAGMFVVGWAATYVGFVWSVAHKTTGKDLEFFIENLSPNVALMAMAIFIGARAFLSGGWGGRILKPLAVLSFGVFLVHYWVLLWVRDWLLTGALHGQPAWVGVPLIAIPTFLIALIIAKAVSLLPGSRWLLG